MITKLTQFLNIEKENKVLIFDLNNLAYRNLHVAFFEAPEDLDFYYWRYLMINSIFSALKQFQPDKVILAVDHPHSWRKGIYADYKGNRKEHRKASKIDFSMFYKVLDGFLIGIKEILSNFYVIKVDKCEADDIIAVIAKSMFLDQTKIIISKDSDLHQLLKYKGVKIYDPIKRKFVEGLNPQLVLEIKILTGDKTDFIPSIKPKVGEKTAIKILNTGLDILLQTPEIKKQYELNRQLIDLDFIPIDLINNIKSEIENYKITKTNEMNLMMWLNKNKVHKFSEDLSHFVPFIRKLEK